MAMMMVVQFGLAYYARTVLVGAAQDGAASGARRDSTPEDGRAVALDLVNDAGSSLILNQQASVNASADRVVVTVEADVVSLIPFRESITVRASGSAPTEEFHPQGSAP